MGRARRALRGALLMLGLATLACGPASAPEVHPVRGRVVRVLDAGRQILVDHEAVPGVMEAMQMTLPVNDPAQARELEPGAKIRFELIVTERGASVGSIERLPPDTPLSLAGSEAHPAAP